MPNNRPPSQRGRSLSQEIAELDQQLVELLVRRSRLMAKAAKARRSKNLPTVEPRQEKYLWYVWEEALKREGGSPQTFKRVFAMLNSLGYETEPEPSPQPAPFVFKPKPEPVDIDASGPGSAVQAAMAMAFSQMAGRDCAVGPVFIADPLFEMAKALNQVGGRASWGENVLTMREGQGLSFDKDVVYVGESAVNFLILLMLAASRHGRVRFSGGASLKLLNLSPLARLMPRLGARLSPVDPKLPGLPARLEASAMVEGPVVLDDPELPRATAAALALAAPFFPSGLDFTYATGLEAAVHMHEALDLLERFGVACEHDIDGETGRFRAAQAEPTAPETFAPLLDPVLCAYVLALPRMAGGRVKLGGMPAPGPLWRDAVAILDAVGCQVETSAASVSSTCGEWPQQPRLAPATPELLPLAAVLGCAGTTKGAAAIEIAEGDPLAADAARLTEAAGCNVELGATEMTQTRPEERQAYHDRPYLAPSPYWALAAALGAYASPGLKLSNPGVLAEAWPGFMRFYTSLPTVRGELTPPPPKKKDDEPKRKGRRIKLG